MEGKIDHLMNEIFNDGYKDWCSFYDSAILHNMTIVEMEILGQFCDYTGIHGDELKQVLIRGWINKRNFE